MTPWKVLDPCGETIGIYETKIEAMRVKKADPCEHCRNDTTIEFVEGGET